MLPSIKELTSEKIVLAAIFLYVLYKLATINFDYWKNLDVPYLKPWPFFGNFFKAVTFQVGVLSILQEVYDKVPGPFAGLWVFNSPKFMVKSPELVKSVLVKDFNVFHNRTIACDEAADPIMSKFLFVIRNPDWRDLRVQMTKIYTSGKLKNMFNIINKIGDDMVEYIQKNGVNKDVVEFKEIFAKFATENFVSTAFGIEANSFKNEDAEFRAIGREMFDFQFALAFRTTAYFFIQRLVKVLKIPFFSQKAYDFLVPVIKRVMDERKTSGVCRNDFIDLMLELRNQKDSNFDENIAIAQCIQFYAGGFETTSALMSFTLYELALHPEMQERVRTEIKKAMEKDESLDYLKIKNMTYLNMVVNEAARKYPLFSFLDRECVQDYQIPGSKVVLPKGTSVYIPMYALQNDPKYFPNPSKFDPERFSEDNISKIVPYTYMPFGDGPHNCIGARFGTMIVKSGLIYILNRFRVEPTKQTPIPIRFNPKSFLLASDVGIPLKIIEL